MEGLIFGILRYLHRKSLLEMLIGGDDISNDVITLGMCFSMFVYILAHCFTLYLRAIFQVQVSGDLYLEGRFNGGFFALPVWGAYSWRGLFSEFYGIYFPSFSL